MATTIKLKNGSGAPLAGDLVAGEPALDLTNKRLYTEDSGGTVIEVGTNPSTINIDAGTIDGTVIGGTTPAAVTTSSLVATTADIDAGSIDGTVIGGSTAAAGSFTTFTSTGIDDNAASTAMTLDASGNLLVGNTVTDPATSNVNGVAITAGGEVIASLNGVAAQFNRRISDGDVAVFKKGGDTKGSIGILSSRLYIGSGDTGIKFSGADDLISPIDASDGTGRDAAIDLGSSGARFKDLYLSGTGYFGTSVGIGTSSPSGPLNVHSASGDTNLYVTTGNTAASTNIFFGDSGNSTIGRIVYDHNGDYMKFRTNGSDAMRIDSSGNVGIGTASPAFALDVNHPSDNGLARFTSGDADAYITISDVNSSSAYNKIGVITHDMYFNTNNTERMRIDSSGNVGIGISSGLEKFTVVNSSSGIVGRFTNNTNQTLDLGVISGSGASGGVFYNNANSGYHAFQTGGTERMRINSNGSLEISGNGANNEISQFLLNVGNPANDSYRPMSCHVASTAARSQILFYNPAGQVGYISTSGTSTSYNTSSDYRLKENVVPLTGATERVKQLNPSRFNFIADADTTVDGFLAHEVADVVPEAITGTKDGMRDEEYEVTPAVYEDVVIPAVLDEEGNEVEAERTEQQLVSEAVMGTRSVPDYQGIDQSKLVPLLVAAIQELEARITALESN